MSAHTKGPWEAADPGDYGDYDGNCIVILGDDKRVAVVIGSGQESRADARLIESAPALLDAARRARRTLATAIKSSWVAATDDEVSEHVIIKELDMAISKATGAAP